MPGDDWFTPSYSPSTLEGKVLKIYLKLNDVQEFEGREWKKQHFLMGDLVYWTGTKRLSGVLVCSVFTSEKMSRLGSVKRYILSLFLTITSDGSWVVLSSSQCWKGAAASVKALKAFGEIIRQEVNRVNPVENWLFSRTFYEGIYFRNTLPLGIKKQRVGCRICIDKSATFNQISQAEVESEHLVKDVIRYCITVLSISTVCNFIPLIHCISKGKTDILH